MSRKICILFILCLLSCMIADADERAEITIRVPETAEFELIQVASIDDGYRYTEEFEDCGIDISEENNGERQTANEFNQYTDENAIEGIWSKSKDGIASFHDLENGLYLIRSEVCVPFLVSYTGEPIDASIKMSVLEPTDVPEPTDIPPTDVPEEPDIPSPTEEVKPTDIPTPTDEPKPTEHPQPSDKPDPTDNPAKPTEKPNPTDKAEPTKKPTETSTEKTTEPTPPVSDPKTTNPTTVPERIEADLNESETNSTSIEVNGGNKSTTTTKQTVTVQDGLPQTGQVWIPYILLFAAGTICIVFGIHMTKRSKTK